MIPAALDTQFHYTKAVDWTRWGWPCEHPIVRRETDAFEWMSACLESLQRGMLAPPTGISNDIEISRTVIWKRSRFAKQEMLVYGVQARYWWLVMLSPLY